MPLHFPENIVGSWIAWQKVFGNNDDDWVDRLNHIFTVVLLVVLAMFVAGGSYVSDPIACFHEDMKLDKMKYVNNYCWISNTYSVPNDQSIPKNTHTRRELEITYYQFVPIILLFMALFFKMPCLVWRCFSGHSGLDIHTIVEMTLAARYDSISTRHEKLGDIAKILDRWLEANRQYHRNVLVRFRQKLSMICFFFNRREGTYLTGLYIIVKLLYVANAVAQFFILDSFLGGFFSLWGYDALLVLAREHATKNSHRFPRTALCDIQLRQFSNIQKYTVQCVLPFNLWNEKIFLLVWYWLVVVSSITSLSLFCWVWKALCMRNRETFVKKYLKCSSRISNPVDKKVAKQFAMFLRDDGVFVVRMIQKNSNHILATDLITSLWDIYREKQHVKDFILMQESNIQNK